MKRITPSPVQSLLVGAVVLVVVGALAVRVLPTTPLAAMLPAEPADQIAASDTHVTVSSPIPAFTSAAVDSGDVLTGLGPEWTVLRQDVPSLPPAGIPKGTSASRETLVKLVNASSTMLLTELTIDNVKTLKASLAAKTVKPLTVAGRGGHLIPVPSETGGSGFLLVGTTSALLIEVGDISYGNLLAWPKDVPSAIQSYLATVKVY